MDEAERVQIKDVNHSALIHIAERGATNAELGGTKAAIVEFTNAWFTEKLVSWAEIWARASTVSSPLSGCKSKYDCTLNAVNAAEKRPAYTLSARATRCKFTKPTKVKSILISSSQRFSICSL